MNRQCGIYRKNQFSSFCFRGSRRRGGLKIFVFSKYKLPFWFFPRWCLHVRHRATFTIHTIDGCIGNILLIYKLAARGPRRCNDVDSVSPTRAERDAEDAYRQLWIRFVYAYLLLHSPLHYRAPGRGLRVREPLSAWYVRVRPRVFARGSVDTHWLLRVSTDWFWVAAPPLGDPGLERLWRRSAAHSGRVHCCHPSQHRAGCLDLRQRRA